MAGFGEAAFKCNFALVSRVPDSFVSNINSFKGDTRQYLEAARLQHEQFVEQLRYTGISVIELPSDDAYPEGVFVEDCAVVLNGTALICKSGSRSRLGEVALVRKTLAKDLGIRTVEIDVDSAALEAGDVLWTGKEIFVGISMVTNEEGAQAVAKAFPEYPTTIIRVPRELKHLKDCITMAGVDVLCCGSSLHAKSILRQISERASYSYHIVQVDQGEDWAANCIYVNNTLIHLSRNCMSKSFPIFEHKFDRRKDVNISELMKARCTLSRLCILLNREKKLKHIPSTLP